MKTILFFLHFDEQIFIAIQNPIPYNYKCQGDNPTKSNHESEDIKMKINGVDLNEIELLVATVEDKELGEFEGFFLTSDELFDYLNECTEPYVSKVETTTVTDLINGAYDLSHADRVEIVAKAVLQPKVLKACKKVDQLEGILEFLGIRI
jgi:hypothetical protein